MGEDLGRVLALVDLGLAVRSGGAEDGGVGTRGVVGKGGASVGCSALGDGGADDVGDIGDNILTKICLSFSFHPLR